MYTVEDKKLIEAVEILDPKIKMPSNKMVASDIKVMYEEQKEKLKKEFEKVEYFSQTNDAGSSSGGKSFVDVNVHWITDDFYPKKKILDVLEMEEEKNADNYRKRVEETEEDFGISNKVFSYTTDNEATMRKAFRLDERNWCFAHIES